MGRYNEIFSALRVRNVELRNRVVVPALHQVRPIISLEGLAWHRRLAAGGAGLVIVERVDVSRFEKDLTPDALRPLVEAIHSGGAAAAIQLWARPGPGQFGPDGLALGQIRSIVDQYGRAAAICRQAGFEGVESHGAHGNLLNQFFMPDKNHRTDEFGGCLDNRCQLGVRIVKQIREVAGEDLLILYRHTPTGDAYALDSSLHLAQRLVDIGVDILDISPAGEASLADLASPFKARFSIPVIAVGGMEDTQFSPQNKPAQQIVKRAYQK